jgi:hypothetical protein
VRSAGWSDGFGSGGGGGDAVDDDGRRLSAWEERECGNFWFFRACDELLWYLPWVISTVLVDVVVGYEKSSRSELYLKADNPSDLLLESSRPGTSTDTGGGYSECGADT